jgi:hypothetical protein
VNRPVTLTREAMPRRRPLLAALFWISAVTPCVAGAQQPPFPTGVFESGGRARATIASNGSMQMEMLGDAPAAWTTRYRVRADTVWVSDLSPACAASGEGSYRWTYDGTTLGLSLIADPCGPRAASGLLSWVRVPTPVPTVVVTATDYAFDAPDTIAAGPVTFRLRQRGEDFHELSVVRLGPGVTMADIVRDVAAKRQTKGIVQLGGVAAVAPHGDGSVTLELTPGHYVIMCGVPDKSGVPHAAKGMLRAMTVVDPAAGAAPAVLAHADVTISMTDYHFAFSAPLAAGSHVIRVRNAGTQPHMLLLMRLQPGKTAQDVVTWVKTRQGPPPAIALGGIAEMDTGHEALAPFDLTPGHYAVMCFSDAPDGKSHVDHGMAQEVTIP